MSAGAWSMPARRDRSFKTWIYWCRESEEAITRSGIALNDSAAALSGVYVFAVVTSRSINGESERTITNFAMSSRALQNAGSWRSVMAEHIWEARKRGIRNLLPDDKRVGLDDFVSQSS